MLRFPCVLPLKELNILSDRFWPRKAAFIRKRDLVVDNE